MPTDDYIIDNANGATVLADINSVLAAIVSNNSSPTEPTTPYAYMWWADTISATLKQRDASNDDWVDILDLTSGASVSTGINDLTNAILDSNNNNIGLGDNVLINLTTGTSNVAIGVDVLISNTTGINNTAGGFNVLSMNITGNNNTAMGFYALFSNTGSNNTAMGSRTLISNTTGINNTAIGHDTLDSNTTGNYNTAIGGSALDLNTTGSNNIAIGCDAITPNVDDNDTITIGNNVTSQGSNYITIGKFGASNQIYNQFIANATWTHTSDERIKKEIQDNENCGLAFIEELETKTYKFKAPSELDPALEGYDKDDDKPSYDKKMYGFVAQQVKQALDKHDITDFAGWHQSKDKDKLQGISYEMFVIPLVKAVQELSKKNQALESKNQALETTVADLVRRVEDLENN